MMKTKLLKKIFAFFATSLCAVLALQAAPIKANAETSSEFPCTYTAAPMDKEYMCYGSSEVITYTADEAAAAGVPAGYSGSVIKVIPLSGQNSVGVLLDFSAQEIPVNMVTSLEFCFYFESHASNTGSRPQLRIAQPMDVNNAWIYQPGSTPSQAGVWTTETVENTNSLFNKIADDNGNLNKFELSVRSIVALPLYIDSIKVNMAENDGAAPIIVYNGADAITVAQGSKLNLQVSAFDVQENCSKEVEYIWGDGVTLDEKGVPTEAGEYTLTLRASDYFGNVAEKTIAVTVVTPDLEAPFVNLTFTEMYVQVGTIPMLDVTVTDNNALAEVTCVWSDGALDEYGRLTEGTHTYTVTATDTSENQTVKTLTVHVSVGEPEYDNVIDEEALMPRYIVCFGDEEGGRLYKHGEKVEKPADPVKEDTEEFTYEFLGWYNGDELWDFENDVVTGDLTLVAKWQETAVEIPVESSEESTSEDVSSEENSEESSEETITSSEELEESSKIEESSKMEESSAPAVSSSDEEKQEEPDLFKGCFGTVGLTMVIPMMLGACVLVLKGKKED